MVVKINDYYGQEIDKLKGGVVKDNYELKSKKTFIALYALGICGDFILLLENISIAVVLIYAVPLMIGAFIEFREMNKYEALDLGLEKIQKLIYISIVRTINIYLFIASGILLFGKYVFAVILYKNRYTVDLNTILIVMIMLVFLFSFIAFFVGVKTERIQVVGNRKKMYSHATIIGTLLVLGVLIFANITPGLFLAISILLEIVLGYAIGKCHFRYKNFDKKVIDDNKMVDYRL